MSQRYWVGGTADWNGTAGTKWSTTSGGAGGSAVPTSSDNVFFDGGSGPFTVTISGVDANTLNLDFSGFNGTLAGVTTGIFLYGNLTLSAGMTITHTGNIAMSATSGTSTITSNGQTLTSQLTFDGAGGTWQLADDLIVTNTAGITLTRGTLDANNRNVTTSKFYCSNLNVKTLTMGGGTWTLTGTGTTVWNCYQGPTLNANTSTIKITGSSCDFSGGGKIYNNFWNASSGGTFTVIINDSNTFNDFKLDPGVTQKFNTTTTQTITSLTANGNSISLIYIISETAGNIFSLSKPSGTVTVNFCHIQDCIGTGGATWNAVDSSDDGNNTGWNFSGNNRYWVGSTASWNGTAGSKWAFISAGTGGVAEPTASEKVYFDAHSGVNTITVDTNTAHCNGLDFTNFTGTISGSTTAIVIDNGDLVFYSGMTNNFQSLFSFNSGTCHITSNGIAFAGTGNAIEIGVGGTPTVTLNDDLLINTLGAVFNLDQGTFNANGHNVTVPNFSYNSTSTAILNMGAGTWTITDTTVTSWNIPISTGLTLNASSSTLIFNGSSSSNTSFLGGGFTYNNFWDNMSGSGFLEIYDNNTFNDFQVDAGREVQFTHGTTTTLSSLTAIGTISNNITLISESSGNAFTLSKSSGNVVVDYCVIQDSHATGGASWGATRSTNSGGNTGWVFLAGDINVFDSITVSENISRTISTSSISVSDSLTLTEFENVIFPVRGNDSITITENVIVLIPTLFITVFDSITITENLSRSISTLVVSRFESITLTENLSLLIPILPISLSDSLTLTENISQNISNPGIFVFESMIETESVSVFSLPIAFSNLLFDSITIRENISLLIPTLPISVFESITITENVSLLKMSFISVFESITVSENVSTPQIILQISVSDSITVSENYFISFVLVSTADSITITENISVLIPVLPISVFDSLQMTEFMNVIFPIVVNAEYLTISENVSVLIPILPLSKSDLLTISENVSVSIVSSVNVNDTINLTENVNMSRISFISVYDSISLTDQASFESFLFSPSIQPPIGEISLQGTPIGNTSSLGR